MTILIIFLIIHSKPLDRTDRSARDSLERQRSNRTTGDSDLIRCIVSIGSSESADEYDWSWEGESKSKWEERLIGSATEPFELEVSTH
jgi:hypothetical protein